MSGVNMWIGSIDRLSGLEEAGPVDRIEELVAEARRGRRDAFGSLYEEYGERIYRYVYARTGQTEVAEDLAQEVFLRAFQRISSYHSRGTPFFAWLVRIAHNIVIDYYRRSAKRSETACRCAGVRPFIASTTLAISSLVSAMLTGSPAAEGTLSSSGVAWRIAERR